MLLTSFCMPVLQKLFCWGLLSSSFFISQPTKETESRILKSLNTYVFQSFAMRLTSIQITYNMLLDLIITVIKWGRQDLNIVLLFILWFSLTTIENEKLCQVETGATHKKASGECMNASSAILLFSSQYATLVWYYLWNQ